MSKKVIEIRDLGKSYMITHKASQRGSYVALKDVITDSISEIGKRASGKNEKVKEEFWALKDVNLDVYEGEKIGIIGQNGSGKTTLLKILSRITEPTKGKVKLEGRAASLLEIGTGFHPELTGRENIYLNGAILGMTRSEINKKFDEIVRFSETEKFLDTPVKRFSSGMYLRLAFSVAAHLEPEIMLIDEVLAVGDASFQKKCLNKMEEYSENERTILFVSHNMTAVKQLCDKVVWLKEGSIAAVGDPEEVISSYLNSVQDSSLGKVWSDGNAPGNEYVKMKSVKVLPEGGNECMVTTDTPVELEFVFENNQEESEINISFVLWTISGECVFNTASEVKKIGKGVYRGVCSIPANLLNNNVYSVEAMIIKNRSYAVFKQKDILNFEVLDGKRVEGWYGKWVGAVRPNLKFSLEEV